SIALTSQQSNKPQADLLGVWPWWRRKKDADALSKSWRAGGVSPRRVLRSLLRGLTPRLGWIFNRASASPFPPLQRERCLLPLASIRSLPLGTRKPTLLSLRALDNTHGPRGWIPRRHILPARPVQKGGILLLRAFAPRAPAHHVDIEQLGKVRRRGVWDH